MQTTLRFSTAGSVDDGKSTLIGRLLFDTKGAYEDQIEAVKKSKVNRSGREIDLSLLTDGLRAEREQGITIDVAYRFFATEKRRFRIADTPGHEQYTRNMATGASTSDAAIILVDAIKGVSRQTLRHATISSLLGIEHLIFAINKMDAMDWSEEVYNRIRGELQEHAKRWPGSKLHYLPVSALDGDNVAWRSEKVTWYNGPSLLDLLETLEVSPAAAPFRFPVQYVVRPGDGFRGFAGRVASGSVQPGDAIVVLPSGRRTTVKEIVTFDGALPRAFEGDSTTLVLSEEVDISRGDLIALETARPELSRHFEADLVWMAEEPLEPGTAYLLRSATRELSAKITSIAYTLDPETGHHAAAHDAHLNDILRVHIETTQPLAFDAYSKCRETGSLILIHPRTNRTIAAGMIVRGAQRTLRSASTLAFELGPVTAGERVEHYGHLPAVVTSVNPELLERVLFEHGALVMRWRGEVPQQLLETGAIVIADSGVAVPEENPLEFLEEAGILLRRNDFVEGEGI
ncbi:sulfate adenylyltransferase subunit 1 [Bryobacter aggregatus]|uniref:sulfate adenylyltransferase subunit 1 n=1 Tax=Bryobacter aggregatus TaxID=360054 RepID=UPI00068C864A|nr:GTP-binding protein [Bryobacter aggregatus]